MANRLLPERFHQGCLANTGFTRHKNHLSLACHGIPQTIVQLVQSLLAAHYFFQTLSRRVQASGSAVVAQWSNELVTTLRKRCNKCRVLRSIAQYFADFQDVLPDTFRIDIRIGPERLEQLVLRDQAVCVLDQVSQYIERLGGKRRTVIRPPDTMVTVSSRKVPNLFISGRTLRPHQSRTGYRGL